MKIACGFAGLITTLAYLQWVERKVIAHVQVRMGPSRVGPHGLLQPLADVIKLMTKEDLLPSYVNTAFYLLAPFHRRTMALISISVIPFGPEMQRVRIQHLHAAYGFECRPAVHSGDQFTGRLWDCACRMGFE